jgi:hypothetical protein
MAAISDQTLIPNVQSSVRKEDDESYDESYDTLGFEMVDGHSLLHNSSSILLSLSVGYIRTVKPGFETCSHVGDLSCCTIQGVSRIWWTLVGHAALHAFRI